MSGDVPQRALKMYFNAPHGEVSRRGLFQSLLPKYGVIPYIESLKCVGERCELCRQSCAFEAIVVDDGVVSIDSLCCRGCGACIGACPRGAIVHPSFSLNQLNVELERLLPDDSNALHPMIVAMVCQSGRHSLDDSGSKVFKHNPNFLPMELPCLSMVSPWLILRAFDLGAQALALIYDRESCPFRFDSEKWQETVRFVQELLDHWGIQPERVSLFEGKDIEEEILDFDRRIAKLAPVALRPSCSTEIRAEDLPLPALIRSMGERLGVPMVGTVSAGAVPFGKLTLEGSQCSGCGVCAADCPTGALIVLPGQDSYRLVLRQESCVGCGQCIKVCPEGCLHLERVLELEKLGCRPETVIEGEFVCCEECGAPIAPRAMIETVRARMAAAGGVTSRLEICPDCKMRTKTGLARTRFGV